MLVLGDADLAHRPGDVVGIDLEARREPVGVVAQRLDHQLASEADQTDVDAPAVHLAERDRDGVLAGLEAIGDVLEHVLRRHRHLVAAGVAEHRPEVVVGTTWSATGKLIIRSTAPTSVGIAMS